jgi:hypothetical protein
VGGVERVLIDSVPFLITTAGYYVLATNLTVTHGDFGIMIQADDVTLDLGGHTLSSRSPDPGDGVRVARGQRNLRIRNGVVRNWGLNGLDLAGADTANTEVEGIRALQNGSRGIVTGPGSRLTDCLSEGNRQAGFVAGANSLVVRCIARGNGKAGFDLGDGAVVRDSNAQGNRDHGVFAAAGASVIGCTTRENGLVGIAAGGGAVIAHCTAEANLDGIAPFDGSTVRDCTARLNQRFGLWAINGCLVTGNVCENNGLNAEGAGIRITGQRNRIEANHLVSNFRGLTVELGGNLIIRNSASANRGPGKPSAGYHLAVGNLVGEVLVSGGDRTVVLTNANPWANFEF